MSNSRRDIKDQIRDIHQEQREVFGEQETVEDGEEQEDSLIEDGERKAQEVGEEIEAAEEDGDPEEFRNAVEDEQKLERILEKQEQKIAQEIEGIEEEMQVLEQEAYDLENAEEGLYEGLLEDIESLEDVKETLSEQLGNPNGDILSEHLDELEATIEDLLERIDLFSSFLEDQKPFLQQFEEFEKEDLKLENQILEIGEELGLSKEEIKELLRAEKQLGDKRGYQSASEEENELEALVKEWKKEAGEQDRIDQVVKELMSESKTILQEDEEVIGGFEKALELIIEIEDILIDNQSRFKPVVTAKSYKTMVSHLGKAEDRLNEVIQKDRRWWETLRDQFKSDLRASNKILERSDMIETEVDENDIDLGSPVANISVRLILLGVLGALIVWVLGMVL